MKILLSTLGIVAVIVILIFIALKTSSSTPAYDEHIVKVDETRQIVWPTNSINDSTAKINVIKMTSNSPRTFDLINNLGIIPNTGSYMWTATSSEIGDNIYIEIACPPKVVPECRSVEPFGPYKVIPS